MKASVLVLAVVALTAVAVPAQATAARTAYVGNLNHGAVTPINTTTNVAGTPIDLGGGACAGIAITPNGNTGYVADECDGTVIPINTNTNMMGDPIDLQGGACPYAIAIIPSGGTAYVSDPCNFAAVPINTATNVAGTPIDLGGASCPSAVAITPGGGTAYVANSCEGTVIPINTTTNVPGTPIDLGGGGCIFAPYAMAVTPNGSTLYVTDECNGTLVPINTATNDAGNPIDLGASTACAGLAITPNGGTAYVADLCNGTVIPVNTGTNVAGDPIDLGGGCPSAIAVTPNGATAYVTDQCRGAVVPINTSTNVAGNLIQGDDVPQGIAITPDQPPTAVFSATSATVGQATGFDASGSSDPDGTVANYAWNFGDGNTSSTSSATLNHSYAAPGVYTATLTVTDQEGCSTAFIFTGQTASCNGSSVAQVSHQVTVKAAPAFTTSASSGVAVGGSVSDTATLAGGQSPTGQITFKLYGPNDSNCSGTPSFTNSVPVNSGNGSYQSGNFTPTAAGVYRWTASYSGDANNAAASSACNAVNESVTVAQAPPTLVTTASAGVVLGGSVHDTATLAGGQSPTGTIIFRLYGPNDAACSGAPIPTDTVSVSGNGNYASADFTPTAPGTYRFTATYSGDSNNSAASTACNEGGESVTVSKTSPTLSTSASPGVAIGRSVRDTAKLDGGSNPGGRIAFKLYGPNDSDCSGKPVFGDGVTISGNRSYPSARFTPSRPGVYRWTAAYSGDPNNAGVSIGCGARAESVWVQKASPELSTQATLGGGDHIGDRARLSGAFNPRGQIVFRLYGPGDNDCLKAPVFTDAVRVAGNGGYASAHFVAPRSGTYRFTATYGGDSRNRAAQSPCNAPGESVTIPR